MAIDWWNTLKSLHFIVEQRTRWEWGTMRLDKTDLRILGELQSDARISVAELAKRVALTPTPCARRLQQLEQAGVIKAYVAVLDQASLGLPVDAFVEVRLTDRKSTRLNSSHSQISYAVFCLKKKKHYTSDAPTTS